MSNNNDICGSLELRFSGFDWIFNASETIVEIFDVYTTYTRSQEGFHS